MKEDYLNQKQQQELIAEAHACLEDGSKGLHRRAWALLGVLTAYYWRARIILESFPAKIQRQILGKNYCPGYKLELDTYIRHWLYANPHASYPDEKKYIIDEYGYNPTKSKYLRAGESVYRPDKEPK